MKDEDKVLLFDSLKLDEEISKNTKKKIYIEDNNTYFSFVDKEIKKEKKEKYFVNLKRDSEQYVGVLTENFKKELFGYILFNQGDEYLGEISNEKKHGFGIYKFNLKEKPGEILYIGNFSNNEINGEGIYIYIYQTEKDNDDKWNSIKLTKYNCCIGLFEKGIFKKGKVYIFDHNYEKLYFKNEAEESLNGKNLFSIEKKDDIILVSKGSFENGKMIEGNIVELNIKDNKEGNKFSFKIKDNEEYVVENLNDNIKNELVKELNNLNFKDYNKLILKCYSECRNMKERIKEPKHLNYAKSIKVDNDFKKVFLDYLKNLNK